MILNVALLAVLVVIFIALVRTFLGPTLFDRILAVNLIGTKAVLLMALIGAISNRPYFLDIAMIYALLNFIGIMGVLRFFELKRARAKDSA